MKDQLMNLQLLVKFLDPELANYLGMDKMLHVHVFALSLGCRFS